MASSHHNFGVFESTDPEENLLLSTVADLKHPPRIPTETEPERVSAEILKHVRVAGLDIPDSERLTNG